MLFESVFIQVCGCGCGCVLHVYVDMDMDMDMSLSSGLIETNIRDTMIICFYLRENFCQFVHPPMGILNI